jgi:tRNA pseudouridine55 synthase
MVLQMISAMECERENSVGMGKENTGFVLAEESDEATKPGIFPVDKPEGISSFRLVQAVRRLLQLRKVGHSGTLDPFASGVLVICAGRAATRLIPWLMEGDKEYEATLQLGVVTDTQDREGKVLARHQVPHLDAGVIAECLERFTGKQMQTPPSYSALKHKGKPLYYYARKGIPVVKEQRQIEIKELQCVAFNRNALKVRIVCSKGTYVRTLGADMGEFLGCGAHLSELKRTRNGCFSLIESLPGEQLFSGESSRSLLEKHRISVDAVMGLLKGNCAKKNQE